MSDARTALAAAESAAASAQTAAAAAAQAVAALTGGAPSPESGAGQQGEPGEPGPPGEPGEPGPPGERGLPGADGAPGAKGDKGDPGDPGQAGVKGDTGSTGLKGDTGSQGLKGDKGDPGTPGTNGTNGTSAVPVEHTLILGTTAALTPAAASAAANVELYATAKATRRRVDLTNATQARLVAAVIATGNAAGGSFKLSYATTEAATWASSTGVADAGPVCVVGTNGGAAGVLHDSGWVNLPAGARTNVTIAALVGTALGTTAPTVGSLTVYFR